MRVLHVLDAHLPPRLYGGIERIVWWLGRELAALGHEVRFLARSVDDNDFSTMEKYRGDIPLEDQVRGWADIVHFHFPYTGDLDMPNLSTVQVHRAPGFRFHQNSVFVSARHARHMSSEVYVHNGVAVDEYPLEGPRLPDRRPFVHFLAKAAWKVKNIRGSVDMTRRAGTRLRVLGGHRLNFKMGFRFTPDRHVDFHGMVGGEHKLRLMRGSSGLLFPVLWHESFGIAMVESLLMGAPVFGTPFGSLPELVSQEVGFLSDSSSELVDALTRAAGFNPATCRAYAADQFNSLVMTQRYLALYEKVLNGEYLNPEPPQAKEMEFRGFQLRD